MITYDPTAKPTIEYVPVAMTGQQSLMGFHRHLLDDPIRTKAFIDAVTKTVRNGDIVADLGTGSGILAMACARAGAKRVYAMESNEIIEAARQLAHANGLSEQVVFLRGESTRTTLPEPVDLVVTECIGLMGPGEMEGALNDLTRRHLKPNGRVIPASISQFLVPVEAARHFEYVHCWSNREVYGFDFSPLQAIASNNVYVAWLDTSSFLSDFQPVGSSAFPSTGSRPVNARLEFEVLRAGQFHGYCGWFEADLGGGIRLSAAPTDAPTVWKQVFLPLETGLSISVGTTIRTDFGFSTVASPNEQPPHLRWDTEVTWPDGSRRVLSQSTIKSIDACFGPPFARGNSRAQ